MRSGLRGFGLFGGLILASLGLTLSASAALSRVRPPQETTFEAELDFSQPDPAQGSTETGWGRSDPSGSAV